MSADPEIVSSVGKLRTSVILLVVSSGAIFYSTQILLDLQSFGKNIPTAVSVPILIFGIVSGVVGLYALYKDWEHESKLKEEKEKIRTAEATRRQDMVDKLDNEKTRDSDETADRSDPKEEVDRTDWTKNSQVHWSEDDRIDWERT